MSQGESAARIATFHSGVRTEHADVLAIEEPLEIRLNTARGLETLTVTMRTPGHDAELAIGFLIAEGILKSRFDLVSVWHADDERNRIDVRVKGAPSFAPRLHPTSSACGVCGTASLEGLRSLGFARLESRASVAPTTIYLMPDRLRAAQDVFDATGGLHAAALFDDSGRLIAVREDIGRHNAFDKLVGHALLEELPLQNAVALVSGRIGFEIAQKCIAARIPILCAVGAPSSLAVELALAYDLTMIGFLRGERFNVYSGQERIAAEQTPSGTRIE